jgi:hypothetical protein
MDGTEVFDELLEPFAFQFPTPHRAEESWESSDDLLVAGHVSRNLLPGDRGKVEKLLLFVPGDAEKPGPPFQRAGVLRWRCHTPFYFAPVAWVNAKLNAALAKRELFGDPQLFDEFAEVHGLFCFSGYYFVMWWNLHHTSSTIKNLFGIS